MTDTSDAGTPLRGDDDGRSSLGEGTRLRQAMALLGVLLAFALLLGIDLIRSRQEIIQAAHRDADNLSRVLERHVSATIDKIDVVLREAAHDFVPILSGKHSIAVQDANQRLLWQEQAIPEAQPESLRVISADGKVLYSAGHTATLPNVMVGDRAYFLRQQNDPNAGLVISEPILSRFTGKWLFVLSRRISDSEGRFIGLVQSAVRADYVESVFATLDVGPLGNISLFDQEFRLAARHPAMPEQLGKSFGLLEVRQGLAENRTTGTYEVASRVDGIYRHYTYRKVDGLPFLVLLGVSPQDFLSGWTIKAIVYCVVFLTLAGVLILLFLLLNRQAKDQTRLAQQVFSKSLEGMIIAGADGRALRANAAFCMLTGLRADQITGQSVTSWFVDRHGASLEETIWHGIQRQGQWRGEVWYYSTQTEPVILWLSVSALNPHGSQSVHYLLSLSDISHLKATEGKLRQLTRAVDQGSDMVVITDCAGHIEYVNDSFCRVTGYDRSDVMGQNPAFLRSTTAGPEIYRDLWTTILDGRVWVGEFENRRKDGSLFWVAASISPIRDEAGMITHFLAVESDISLRKEMDARLIAAKETAEAADRTKSEFLATMSHEIRTPMNGIIGMCGLLLDTNLDSPQSHYAKTIRQSAESLLSIINDILDFSRIESGRLELEDAPFEIRDLVDGVVDILSPRVKGRPLELRQKISPASDGVFLGDGGRIRQILLNLVGNAVKFTERGHVAVHAHILQRQEQEWLRISVKDSGIGIPEAAQAKLFSMFTQADPSIARRHGGSGLGLAICKRIVEMMGGCIGLFSRDGFGSTFWFEIPLKRADASVASAPARLDGLHILLVDDESERAAEMSAPLIQCGAKLHVVHDVGAGLISLRAANTPPSKPFDVIVLDQHMPGLSGLDMISVMNSDPALSQIPIVLLTEREWDIDDFGFKTAVILPSFIHPLSLGHSLAQICGRNTEPTSGKAQSAAQPTPQPLPNSTDPQRSLRILVVEDNAINQQVAVGVLKKLGHRADVANDGGEGVSMVERCDYDLILMDMQMPNVDGITATRMIRALPSAKSKIPIIAMTANAMSEDRERCLQAGMDDYVSKPIDRRRLIAALERWSASAPSVPSVNSQIPEPPATSPILQELIEALGSEGVLELLRIFATNAQQQMVAIATARQDRDLAALGRLAHSIKGAALNLGLSQIVEPAMALEMLAKSDQWPDDSLFQTLQASLATADLAANDLINRSD